MSVFELESEVRKLSKNDLAQFRAWFAEFDSEAWDRRLQNDIQTGRLDAFAEEAVRDLQSGQVSDL